MTKYIICWIIYVKQVSSPCSFDTVLKWMEIIDLLEDQINALHWIWRVEFKHARPPVWSFKILETAISHCPDLHEWERWKQNIPKNLSVTTRLHVIWLIPVTIPLRSKELSGQQKERKKFYNFPSTQQLIIVPLSSVPATVAGVPVPPDGPCTTVTMSLRSGQLIKPHRRG